MESKLKLKIIIPALNEEDTIIKTIESLAKQDFSKFEYVKLCVIDDGSKDKTSLNVQITFDKYFPKNTKLEIIKHNKPMGISASQNDGLADFQKYDLLLLCQADIVIEDESGINKLTESIINHKLGATYPYVIHLENLWRNYPFWQKVLLDRQIDRKSESRIAKLSMLTKECVNRVGSFDESITGTEDRDYFERISKLERIEVTDLNVIHIHNAAKTFSWKKLVYKEGQQAEGSACMVRKYGIGDNFIDTLFVLFRPLIALLNLIPIVNFISIPLTLLFFYFYSRKTIIYTLTKEFNFRIFLILPVLIYSLYVSLFVFIISLLTSKVNYFRNK